MTISYRPIQTTLVFGLFCGFLAVPVSIVFSCFADWSRAFCLTLGSFVALYGILLSRWTGKSLLSLAFPLLLLLLSVFWFDSIRNYFLFSLIILSWIRSGICFQKYPAGRGAVESAICLGTGLFLSFFTPDSTFGWAMGIWLFFLVQTLFFVFFDRSQPAGEDKFEIDPFEQAGRKVEKILSTAYYP